jgi:hypothetical protein
MGFANSILGKTRKTLRRLRGCKLGQGLDSFAKTETLPSKSSQVALHPSNKRLAHEELSFNGYKFS